MVRHEQEEWASHCTAVLGRLFSTKRISGEIQDMKNFFNYSRIFSFSFFLLESWWCWTAKKIRSESCFEKKGSLFTPVFPLKGLVFCMNHQHEVLQQSSSFCWRWIYLLLWFAWEAWLLTLKLIWQSWCGCVWWFSYWTSMLSRYILKMFLPILNS